MFSNSCVQLKWSLLDKHRRRAHFTTFRFHYGEVVINTRRLAPWLARSPPVPTSCQFPASVLREEDVLLFWMYTDKREWCLCLWLWAWLNIPLGDFPIHGKVWEIPTWSWSWVCWCYHYQSQFCTNRMAESEKATVLVFQHKYQFNQPQWRPS